MMRKKTFKTKHKARSAHSRIRVQQFIDNLLFMRMDYGKGGWFGSTSRNIMRNAAKRKENLCLNRVLIRKGWA